MSSIIINKYCGEPKILILVGEGAHGYEWVLVGMDLLARQIVQTGAHWLTTALCDRQLQFLWICTILSYGIMAFHRH